MLRGFHEYIVSISCILTRITDSGLPQASMAERRSALPPAIRESVMSIIPFSRDLAFDPDHVQVMLSAFDAVCAKLQLVAGKGDQATDFVALRIIDLAKTGERDADRMTALVLAQFDGGLDR
jgi:hypothetical protein